MKRDLNTCSTQSAMPHGVRVRVFFRRGTNSRNDSSSITSCSHHGHFYLILLVFVPGTFLRVLTTSIILVQLSQERVGRGKNTEQDQPAAAAAAAEDAESTSEHLRIQPHAIYFGLILEDEKTAAPSSSHLRHHCDYPTHVQQQRYSYQVPLQRYLPQTLPVPPFVERAWQQQCHVHHVSGTLSTWSTFGRPTCYRVGWGLAR